MFDAVKFFVYVLKKKIFLGINFILACAFALYYVLNVVQPQYVSEITFFPPRDQSGALNLLSGALGISGGMSGGNDVLPQQIEILFYSNKLRKKFIDEMGLYEKYGVLETKDPFVKAQKILSGDLTLSVEELGNLGATTPISFKLGYFHSDPDSAVLGVEYMYNLLDSAIQSVTNDIGIAKLETAKSKLDEAIAKRDSIQKEFNRFQIQYKAYDIPKQMEKSIELYAELQSRLMAKEALLKQALYNYSPNSEKVIAIRNEIKWLRLELKDFLENSDPKVIGGITNASKRLAEYTNFLTDLELQTKIVLLQTQQYESAKLKAEYSQTSLRVVDPAIRPDYKTRPSRAKVVLIIVFAYMFLIGSMLTLRFLYIENIKTKSWYGEITNALFKW